MACEKHRPGALGPSEDCLDCWIDWLKAKPEQPVTGREMVALLKLIQQKDPTRAPREHAMASR